MNQEVIELGIIIKAMMKNLAMVFHFGEGGGVASHTTGLARAFK